MTSININNLKFFYFITFEIDFADAMACPSAFADGISSRGIVGLGAGRRRDEYLSSAQSNQRLHGYADNHACSNT